jgi:iron transport multicopper oxidase
VSFVPPKVPTLYSVLSSGSSATNVAIYGSNTNAFILNEGEVVEIVLNSDDPGKHPFHLHGHAFQAVWRGEENDGYYSGNESLSQIPMRRDTFMVRPQSNIVLRFRADNPGVWLFHCHIEWHIDSGLVATMIESPLALQAQNLTIPDSHWDACKAQDIPTAGNAAGNTKDLTDLTGENVAVAPLPDGFTSRGIVALVFSCVSAFLGMAFVVWYGVGEVRDPKKRQ